MEVGALQNLAKTPSADTALSNFAEDFDDFLQLLVAQLQNQDPTSPLETNEFTAQIVSFTGVEQEINTNKKLEALIELQLGNQTSNLVSFVGKEVEVAGNSVVLESEGNVSLAYNLDEPAEKVFVTIRDLQGNVVFNGDGTNNAGRNNLQWDGKGVNGERLPVGLYDVRITKEDASGALTEQPLFVKGRVVGVNLDGEQPRLIVNGEEIPLSEVKFVGEAV